MNSHNPIIIALDLENADQAWHLVRRLGHIAPFYKVGLELFTAAGMPFVRELIEDGRHVFLDLKLYDIGETVKRTVARAAESGAHLLTVHAMGAVMRAAVEGRGEAGLKLLGVTVLTSFDQRDIDEDGYPGSVSELVSVRARNAVSAGVDGVVCSPLDAAMVRGVIGPKRLLVTPGVRSAQAGAGDQKRIATPAEAVQAGADYLVIGRQVTRSNDPAGEVERIMDEIAGVEQRVAQ